MIKPKYPKRADLNQIARFIVEHATGGPLTPLSDDPISKKQKTRKHSKQRQQNSN